MATLNRTVSDLIIRALKGIGVIGVGQTALTEDTTDAFEVLQELFAEWQPHRYLIWDLIETVKTMNGALSYTIGPSGADITQTRPDRIENAFMRLTTSAAPNQVDYPLRILTSREDYNRISMKSLNSFPMVLFYDSGFPNGTIYPWPLGSSIYDLHFFVKANLPSLTSLTNTISVPDVLIPAINYNLMARLRPLYGLPPDPTTTALAKSTLNTAKIGNVQIPLLQQPGDLLRGGIYDIYADQIK